MFPETADFSRCVVHKFCPEHHPWLAPRGWIHLDEYEDAEALEHALRRIFWKKLNEAEAKARIYE